MVGRQRKAVAVGHKGIAGVFAVGAGAPAHRAAVLRDDQLGVVVVQHRVQCGGQRLLGLILGLPGGGILPSLGQIGNFCILVHTAEDIAGKVDIALCGCAQRHVELEVVQERLLIRAVVVKSDAFDHRCFGAADDGLGLAQRAVRAVKAAIVIAAGNNAEAQCLALILLQIQRQAADVARGGQRQHSFAAGIDGAQVIVVNALVVGRRPSDRVEQGIRVVGLAVDAGDGARCADGGQALLNAVIRHSGRADFVGVGCRHAGDLKPDLVIAPAIAAVGQHGIHVDRQGKVSAILYRRQGDAVLQRNLLLTGHIAVRARQQAVELDLVVGGCRACHAVLRPFERVGQLIVGIHFAAVGIFRQRRGFQDGFCHFDQLHLVSYRIGPSQVLCMVRINHAQWGQGCILVPCAVGFAYNFQAVHPPRLCTIISQGFGSFLFGDFPAGHNVADTTVNRHSNGSPILVVRQRVLRQAAQGKGRICVGNGALLRGQRDILAFQRIFLPVQRYCVVACILGPQHNAVDRVALCGVGRRKVQCCLYGQVVNGVTCKGNIFCGQRTGGQTVLVAPLAAFSHPSRWYKCCFFILCRAHPLGIRAYCFGISRNTRCNTFKSAVIHCLTDVLRAVIRCAECKGILFCVASVGRNRDFPTIIAFVIIIVCQHKHLLIGKRAIRVVSFHPGRAYQAHLNLRCGQGVHKGLHVTGSGVVWQRRVVVGVVGRYTHDEVTCPCFISHKGIAALVDVSSQVGGPGDVACGVAGQDLHTVVRGGAGVRIGRRFPRNLVTAIDVIICVRGLAGLDRDILRLGGLGAVQHVLIVVLDDLVGDVGNINVRFRTIRGFAELQHHVRSLLAGIGIVARTGIIENVGFVTDGLDVGRVWFGIPIRRNSASHPPQTVRCAVPTLYQIGQECNIRIGCVIIDVIAYVQTVCFYFFRVPIPLCFIVGRVPSFIIRSLPVACCTVRFFCGQSTLILFIEALAFTVGFFNIIVAVAGDILATQAQIGNRKPICTNRRKTVCDVGCFIRPRAIAAAADNADISATRKDCIKVSAAVNIYRNIFNFPLVVRADPCQNADCLRRCLDCTAIDAVDDVQCHNIGGLLHLDFTDNARTVIRAV